MIKSNSEKPLERVRPFFDRCALMLEYKMLMYVKNKENLLLFDSDVILPLMKMYSKDIGMYENDGENSCMIRFDNGSIFEIIVIESDKVVIKETCNVLFVDNKIREKELLSVEPKIDVYRYADDCGLLNPKPIYLNLHNTK